MLPCVTHKATHELNEEGCDLGEKTILVLFATWEPSWLLGVRKSGYDSCVSPHHHIPTAQI